MKYTITHTPPLSDTYVDIIRHNEHIHVIHYKEGVFHGVYKMFFNDNQIALKGGYLLGKKHGRWIEWYKSGQIKSIRYYYKSKKVGLWVEWFENGVKKYEMSVT